MIRRPARFPDASRTRPRAGFTLFELLVVIVALIVLGAILIPTLSGLSGDSKVNAGTDLLRQRVAEARSHAIGEGRIYRVTLAPEGNKIRVTPQDDTTQQTTAAEPEKPFFAEDAFPDGVTVRLVVDSSAPPATDSNGWTVLGTFLPDGTCREDSPEIVVSEPGCYPMQIQIRGLTGATTITAGTNNGGTPGARR